MKRRYKLSPGKSTIIFSPYDRFSRYAGYRGLIIHRIIITSIKKSTKIVEFSRFDPTFFLVPSKYRIFLPRPGKTIKKLKTYSRVKYFKPLRDRDNENSIKTREIIQRNFEIKFFRWNIFGCNMFFVGYSDSSYLHAKIFQLTRIFFFINFDWICEVKNTKNLHFHWFFSRFTKKYLMNSLYRLHYIWSNIRFPINLSRLILLPFFFITFSSILSIPIKRFIAFSPRYRQRKNNYL